MKAKDLIEILEAMKSLPLQTLIDNSEKVFGRTHYVDRTIKIEKMTPQIGVKSLRIDGSAHGNKFYPLSMIFYDMEYSDKKDAAHPLTVQYRTDGDIKTTYASKLTTKQPVRIFCGCASFRYYCEWYLAKSGNLLPQRKPRPYHRVPGSTRPSVNPLKLPNLCKHVYQMVLELKKRGLM